MSPPPSPTSAPRASRSSTRPPASAPAAPPSPSSTPSPCRAHWSGSCRKPPATADSETPDRGIPPGRNEGRDLGGFGGEDSPQMNQGPGGSRPKLLPNGTRARGAGAGPPLPPSRPRLRSGEPERSTSPSVLDRRTSCHRARLSDPERGEKVQQRLVDDLRLLQIDQVPRLLDQQETGPGDAGGQVPAGLGPGDGVLLAGHDQGRDRDRGEQVGGVRPGGHAPLGAGDGLGGLLADQRDDLLDHLRPVLAAGARQPPRENITRHGVR